MLSLPASCRCQDAPSGRGTSKSTQGTGKQQSRKEHALGGKANLGLLRSALGWKEEGWARPCDRWTGPGTPSGPAKLQDPTSPKGPFQAPKHVLQLDFNSSFGS